MLIPTYFCDCCGHAFSHPVATFMRDKCPKCGDFNFELLIPEKGAIVRKTIHPSDPERAQAQDPAHYLRNKVRLAVGWIKF